MPKSCLNSNSFSFIDRVLCEGRLLAYGHKLTCCHLSCFRQCSRRRLNAEFPKLFDRFLRLRLLDVIGPEHGLDWLLSRQIKWLELETHLKPWLVLKPARWLTKLLLLFELACSSGVPYQEVIATVRDGLVLIDLFQPVEKLFNFLSSFRNYLVSKLGVNVHWHTS